MDSGEVKLLIALIVLVAAIGAWVYRDRLFPPEPVPVSEPAAESLPVDAQPARPKHPISKLEPIAPVAENLVTLPPLDDSDAYFLLALVDVFGTDIEALLVKEALIDKVVATIDNLPRKHVAEKVRPVGRLAEPFRANAAPGDGPLYLDPDNFRRYETLVGMIESADVDAVAELYRRFYPLFQESYERLGYPDGYFNDRVVEVIGHLLEAPQPDESVRLVRPHVLYEFADPELESRSSGQKLLVRMGPDNAAIVMGVLAEIRERIR